ncbi:MAG TPA: helix-turn-helix domain-containing protein [Flexivirga sp.]|uniref:TetR/AcrR family transcriptional regulator n=1 Tax=Flexivirga sp. TaxID=1962927 RepID=UPI002C0B312E|nr:helix-turn-helix domain-containing protein [Flexivirga sp.]HWC23151.1 helix-turn-helix domain-containing protein [Flexivirga sp.]
MFHSPSTNSAPRLRIAVPMSAKRARTTYAITRAARELAADKGYDEFTLDELAERAGVSRRTLFNYFDGKLEATLGGGPQLTQDDIDTFLAGGPTGEFVDDVAALALGVLRASTDIPLQPDDWVVARRCFEANPKLIFAAQQNFEGFAEGILELLARRSGRPADDPENHLLLSVLAGIFKISLHQFSTGQVKREIPDIFRDNLQTVRRLLA